MGMLPEGRMESEVIWFFDVLMANPKTLFGTAKTFIKWNVEELRFECWRDDVLLWSMPYDDRDPFDIERDLVTKLWQALGG